MQDLLDLARQAGEGLAVPEEIGDADHDVLEQQIELHGPGLHVVQIFLNAGSPTGRHAPVYPAIERAGFVVTEIDSRTLFEKMQQFVHRRAGNLLLLKKLQIARRADDGCDLRADFRRRQHKIDGAGRDGVRRHPVILRLLRILGDRQAALGLDGANPVGAVRAGSRQDHADRMIPDFLGKRGEEIVHRRFRREFGRRARQEHLSVADEDVIVGRRDVDRAALGCGAALHLFDRHRRFSAEQLHQHALVSRRQVLSDDIGDVRGTSGQSLQDFAQCLKTTGRGADPDPVKVFVHLSLGGHTLLLGPAVNDNVAASAFLALGGPASTGCLKLFVHARLANQMPSWHSEMISSM